jgi:putative metal-binding protein
VNRKRTLRGRFVVPCLILLLTSAVSVTTAATLTRYDDTDSFSAALGGAPRSLLTFEEYEAGTFINDQYPGVVFSSPNSDFDGYLPIQIVADPGAVSGSQVLEGGSVPGVESPYEQVMVLDFSPAVKGFAFYLADYLPAAGPASIRFEFATEDPPQTLLLSNTTGSETTAAFLGAVSDTPIVRVTITSGNDPGGVFEEYTIDDVVFAVEAGDTTAPVCTGRPATESGVLGIDGTATDFSVILEAAIHLDQFQAGIVSVALDPGASNVTLDVTPFDAGAASVSFRATQTDASRDAQGTVRATDGGGNTCTLPVTFRALGPGPIQDQVVCSGEGFLFSVSNGAGTPAGTSACGAQLPASGDPALPPGYAPSPPDDPFPCRVLTIDSPLSGDTLMVLKKDGVFDPNLRMIFSESTDGGVTFPPFNDVTQTVESIANISPDPTRLGGKVKWTPVKVDCALLSDGSRLGYCASLPPGSPGPDFDGDGYTLCGSETSPADCNDQLPFVHPGAAELCNGMDDTCDGAID